MAVGHFGLVCGGIVTKEDRRGIFEITQPIDLIGERHDDLAVIRLVAEQMCRGEREDRKAIRRAVTVGRFGYAVLHGEVTAVDLIGDDIGTEAEWITITQPGVGKDPVVGLVNRVRAAAVGYAVAKADITAATETQPRGLIFWPVNPRVRPNAGQQVCLIGAYHRIGRPCRVFVTDHFAPVVLIAHLPVDRIARKEGDIPPRRDKLIDRITDAPRPILIMAHADHQLVVAQQFRVGLQVTVDRKVDLVAVARCPGHKAPLPIPPAAGARPKGNLVIQHILLQALVIGIRCRSRLRHAPVKTIRIDRLNHQSRLQRPRKGDRRRAGVETLPAPLVVGIVGIGA